MANLRPFQIVLLAVFAVLAVVAVILLSTFSGSVSDEERRFGERVIVWGPFPARVFDSAINEISNQQEGFEVVDYVQINPRTFSGTFVNAVAEGNSPDLVLLPSSELVSQRSKLLALSYEIITERFFRDTYIDGAEIFARPDGVYGIPFGVDPLILYWNRDMFASAGFAQAPTTWEHIVGSVVPGITVTDATHSVLQSALGFGESNNVRNVKEILLLLALQSGSRMIFEEDSRYMVELNRSVSGNNLPPLEAAAYFFTNFSNPANQLYSWNRQQQLDRNAFLAGDLAMYIGYGTEYGSIASQNPNLSFDVASVPQGASATIRRTFGEFYAFAIPKAAQNQNGAFAVANILTQPTVSDSLTSELGIAPAQRAAVVNSTDPIRQVILSSALVARAWLDPSDMATDDIVKDMIEDITSSRLSTSEAVDEAVRKIRLAF